MAGDPQNAGRGRDMKHTPEPWEWNTHGIQPATKFKQVRFLDYQRAKSCVNACAGMDDPAAEIERLRDMEKNIAPILQTVRALAQQISGDKSIDQMTRLEALGLLMAIPAEKGTNP
jgi:hypothetical protein